MLTCGFREVVFLCTVICWKNPHSWKETKMATPLEFCRGMSRPVSWCRYITKTCDEFESMWAGHVSASLRVTFGLSLYVFGAFALDLPFGGGTLKLGKYYIQYSFRVWCYLNALSVAFLEIWRIVYHSSELERCVISPALDVIHAQLQRLQGSRKIRTLSTAVSSLLPFAPRAPALDNTNNIIWCVTRAWCLRTDRTSVLLTNSLTLWTSLWNNTCTSMCEYCWQ